MQSVARKNRDGRIDEHRREWRRAEFEDAAARTAADATDTAARRHRYDERKNGDDDDEPRHRSGADAHVRYTAAKPATVTRRRLQPDR